MKNWTSNGNFIVFDTFSTQIILFQRKNTFKIVGGGNSFQKEEGEMLFRENIHPWDQFINVYESMKII